MDIRKNMTIEDFKQYHVPGDIVRHFKWETNNDEQCKEKRYLYKIVGYAKHTETKEQLVIYQALYAPYDMCARPIDMFVSEVDHEKYPDIKQLYRLMKSTIDGQLI